MSENKPVTLAEAQYPLRRQGPHPGWVQEKEYERLAESYRNLVEAARAVSIKHDYEPSFCGAGICANCTLRAALPEEER